MIKISKLADYAVVALTTLYQSDEQMLPISTLAQRANLPEPTVSKVMKMLGKAAIVDSVRGATGGYKTLKPVDQLTVADIIAAIDGPIALTACVDDTVNQCGLIHSCAISGRWTSVNNAVKNALQSVKLADMMQAQIAIKNKGVDYVANR